MSSKRHRDLKPTGARRSVHRHAQIIELPDTCVDAPTAIDADLVTAWMLWPDDPTTRQAAFGAHCAKRLYEQRGSLTREDLEGALALALATPGVDSLREMTLQPTVDGAIAGNIFLNVIAGVHRGKPVTLGNEVGRHSKALMHDGNADSRNWPLKSQFPNRPLPTSKTERNHAWRKFKPVAHYWAAMIYRELAEAASEPFPCRVESLGAFLSRSHQLLTLAKSAHLPHAGTLGAGDAVKIPASVRVRLPKLAPPNFGVAKSKGDGVLTGKVR